MNGEKRIIIPKCILDIISNPNGFTVKEILEIQKTDEVKKFLDETTPLVKEVLKKEFPMLSPFIK